MAEKHDYDWEEVCLGGEFFEAVAREYYKFMVKDVADRMCVAADEGDKIRSRFAPPEYDWNADPDGLLAGFDEPYHPGEALTVEAMRQSLSDISQTVSDYARTGMKLSAANARDLGKTLAMHQTGWNIDKSNSRIRTIVRKRRRYQPFYDIANSAIGFN